MKILEEQQRFQRVLQLLGEINQECLAKLIETEQQDGEEISRILDASDRKIIETGVAVPGSEGTR